MSNLRAARAVNVYFNVIEKLMVHPWEHTEAFHQRSKLSEPEKQIGSERRKRAFSSP